MNIFKLFMLLLAYIYEFYLFIREKVLNSSIETVKFLKKKHDGKVPKKKETSGLWWFTNQLLSALIYSFITKFDVGRKFFEYTYRLLLCHGRLWIGYLPGALRRERSPLWVRVSRQIDRYGNANLYSFIVINYKTLL